MKTKRYKETLGVLEELKGVKRVRGRVVYSRGEKVGQYFLGCVRILDFILRGIENY